MINFKRVIIFLIGLLFTYYLYEVVKIFIKLRSSSNHAVVYPRVTNTYSEIFRDDFTKYIKPSFTYYTEGKNPVATFTSLRSDRTLVIYLINNVKSNDSADSILKISTKNFEYPTSGVIYTRCFYSGFSRFLNANVIAKPSKLIYFSLDGNVLNKQSISDSLLLYKVFANRIGFQYVPSGLADFYFEDTSLLSAKKNILFALLKTGKKIYIIFELPKMKDTNVHLNPLLPQILR